MSTIKFFGSFYNYFLTAFLTKNSIRYSYVIEVADVEYQLTRDTI